MTGLEIVTVSNEPDRPKAVDPKPLRMPSHLSFSALSTYAECGERYRLERGHGISGPSWWNALGGSAVHEVTEMADRAQWGEPGAVEDFATVFDRLIDEEVEKTGWPEDSIKASGRKTKAWPDKQNRAWWYTHGPLYVAAWFQWRERAGLDLWTTPWGAPGIEVPVEVLVAGRKFVGYIDRVFVDPSDGTGIPVDLKCGNHEPKSSLQLGTYGVALERDFGLPVRLGGFWMAKDYKEEHLGLKYLEDLSRFTPDFVDAQFAMAWRGITGGVFLPSPGMMCGSCPVRDFCGLMGGSRAGEVPVLDDLSTVAELESSTEVKQITP